MISWRQRCVHPYAKDVPEFGDLYQAMSMCKNHFFSSDGLCTCTTFSSSVAAWPWRHAKYCDTKKSHKNKQSTCARRTRDARLVSGAHDTGGVLCDTFSPGFDSLSEVDGSSSLNLMHGRANCGMPTKPAVKEARAEKEREKESLRCPSLGAPCAARTG